MFRKTFDQPFDLVITSTECSPIVYFQSNSSNEIRVSIKSRVTVSIEKPLDNVNDSFNLVPPDSGKVNNSVFGSSVKKSNTDHETCSPPTPKELSSSTSMTNGISVECVQQNSGCEISSDCGLLPSSLNGTLKSLQSPQNDLLSATLSPVNGSYSSLDSGIESEERKVQRSKHVKRKRVSDQMDNQNNLKNRRLNFVSTLNNDSISSESLNIPITVEHEDIPVIIMTDELQERFGEAPTGTKILDVFNESSTSTIIPMKLDSNIIKTSTPKKQKTKVWNNFDTLKEILPRMCEFALFIRPTKIISTMYNYFLDHFCKEKRLMDHFDYLRLCLNHPALYHKVYHHELFQANASEESNPPELNTDVSQKKYWYEKFEKEVPYFFYCVKIKQSFKFLVSFEILSICISFGEKLVVASQSVETLKLLENEFKRFGNNCFRIDGSVQVKERQVQIEKFNDPENKEARLCLLSTKAGGIEIDLHGANRIIIFDVSWNSSDDINAICRLYRMGQTKPVSVYRFVTKDTMEEVMFREQMDKRKNDIRAVNQRQDEKIHTTSELNKFYDTRPKDCYQIPDIIGPQSDCLLSKLVSSKNEQVLGYIELNSLLEQ